MSNTPDHSLSTSHSSSSSEEYCQTLSKSVTTFETLSWTKMRTLVEEAEKMPVRIRKQLLQSLSQWSIKHTLPEEERSVPTGKSFDLDGLCLVGKVGQPLSFLKDRRKSDEELVVFADHRTVAKYTAGKVPNVNNAAV